VAVAGKSGSGKSNLKHMCRPGRLLYLKQCGLNKQHRHRGPLSSSCSPRSALPKLCPCVAPAPAVDFTKFYATFFHSAQLTFFCTLFYYLTGNLQPPKVPIPRSVQRPGAYSFEPFLVCSLGLVPALPKGSFFRQDTLLNTEQ
jgi:hypothetical protein